MSVTSDRALGLQWLKTYHSLSGLAFRGVSEAQLVAYYDGVAGPTPMSPGGFIGQLGSAIRGSNLSSALVRDAFVSLSRQADGKIPHHADFIPALLAKFKGLSYTARVVSESVVDAGATALKVVTGGAALYLLVGAVVFAVILGGKGVRAPA